jgi:putative endonuclease
MIIMFYVYILRSKKNGRFYIGSTKNLKKRLEEHNKGRSKTTRYIRPLELIYKERYSTRSEAAKREKFLKMGQGRVWLKERFS